MKRSHYESASMPPRRRIGSARSSIRQVESQLRVIGGSLRGRIIRYNGDPGLRPMKDRVREAVFNLIGPRVVGTQVVDLFAGTGAMTIESLSRGALRGTLIERRFPNVEQIKETAAELGIEDRIDVVGGDAFVWGQRLSLAQDVTWLIFCCPPYEFYQSRLTELQQLIRKVWDDAPAGSVLVVESNELFDPQTLLSGFPWDVRPYPPAVIGIAHK